MSLSNDQLQILSDAFNAGECNCDSRKPAVQALIQGGYLSEYDADCFEITDAGYDALNAAGLI